MSADSTLYVFRGAEDARAFNPAPAGRVPDFQSLPFSLAMRGAAPPSADLLRGSFAEYPAALANLLKGIDYLISIPEGIDVLNLSLGPRGGTFDPDDPLQIATRFAHDHGVPVVVAAGNDGPDHGTMQSLALAPWTIPVGAADPWGNRLLDSSSRGKPGARGPVVVGSGMQQIVLVDGRNFEPGTSFAAAHVSQLVPWIRKALELLASDIRDVRAGQWSPENPAVRLSVVGIADTGVDPRALDQLPHEVRAVLDAGRDSIRLPRAERERVWLAQVIGESDRLGFEIEPAAGPDMVERALRSMAKSMPNYEPHEVGAGFVSMAEAAAFLSGITPSRLVALFSQRTPTDAAGALGSALDRELGPLWDESFVRTTQTYFCYGNRLAVAKVM